MTHLNQTDSDNDFAEMNSVVVPKSLDKEALHITQPSTSDTHQEELETTNEPEQFVTKRQQWEQPWHKAIIVGGGMLIFVTFFGSMVHGTLQAINKSTGKNSGTTDSNSIATRPPDGVVENEDEVNRKIAALTTQANAISAINANKKPDSINKSDTDSASMPPTPHKTDSTSVSLPPPPTRSSTPPPPTAVYRTNYPNRQAGYSKPYRPPALSTSPTLAYPPPVTRQVSLPVPPPPVAKPLPRTSKTEPKAAPDPMQQWLAAANVGSYGSTSPQSNSRNAPAATTANYISNSRTNGRLSASPVMTQFQQAQPRPELANYSTAATNIVVGTKASAKLETPIAWSGKLQNPNQNFLIQLTEPLLTANKSVAIPKGAYLVVRINDAADTGLLQMSATSALVTENGRTIEKPIPIGALLVLGKGGNLLKAQSQKRSNTGADLGMAVLSGVSNVTGLINQPSSQSTFSSGGGFQTTTTNRDPNYLAGFGQGAAQAIVGEMQARNQQARQSIQSEPKVFVLNQGTAVQVFVNQSVAL